MKMLSVLGVLGLWVIGIVFLPFMALAQSPGDTVGSTGTNPRNAYYGENQIDLDTTGALHFAWMNTSNYPIRYISYNYRAANGYWLYPRVGEMVNFRMGTGYPEISVLADGRALIAAHSASAGAESIYVAKDAFSGIGSFDIFHMRLYRNPDAFIWPRVSVDHSGRIHVVATQMSDPGQQRYIGYRMSSDEGMTWNTLQTVGQTRTIEAMVIASEVSNKVAIIYKKPFDGNYYSQDISYFQSEDGVTWDFENGLVNVTDYVNDPDSLRPVGQIDAVYNSNDNLQIIWTARQITNGNFGNVTYLYHFENGDGIIREIAHRDPQGQPNCRIDRVNSIDQPTIAVRQGTNKVVVAYIGYDPTDCDIDSLPNGDVFLQWSDNFGADWSNPLNITNSQTPGCINGDCASDVNPSLAKDISTSTHLMYACDNRLTAAYLYYPIPVSSMESHENDILPGLTSLSQNYPNPFNAVTTIRFEMAIRGHLNLSVFDITGVRVATLVDGIRDAGAYDVKWDAGDMPSGTYFYRADFAGETISQKMILLK